jgi:hypothetical protein
MNRVEIPDWYEPEETYLRRWILFATPWFGVNLHHILRSDGTDRGYHDHPWSFFSIRLKGTYTEYVLRENDIGFEVPVRTRNRRFSFRRAEDAHRVDVDVEDVGCWTLIFKGPRRREWGFRQPNGEWIHHLILHEGSGRFYRVGRKKEAAVHADSTR